MDAKQITEIDRQRDNQAQERFTVSNRHSEQGFAFFAQALDAPTPGIQKPLLLKACDAFAEGIRFQRSNPEPYIGFAYVLLMLDKLDKALGYVKEAQRLAPEHEDVVLLLEELQRRTKPKPSAAAGQKGSTRPPARPAKPDPDAIPNLDYDALYDKLELEIMTDVKSLMTAPGVELKASIEAEQIARLQQKIQKISKRQAYYDRQLKILDEEIDIAPLSLKLKPIDGMLKRFEKALKASELLTALCRDIAEQSAVVRQILLETKASQDSEDVPIVEENLEVLLDHLDLFANRLDQLETQGHNIEAGLRRYNPMLAMIEDLQDALEDLKLKSGTA